MHKRTSLLLFVLIMTFSHSCGYRFAGSGNLPEGVQRISVDIIKNNTAETGLGNTFTNDLIYEFIRSGRTVYPNQEGAEAVLSGTIRSIGISSAVRSDSTSSTERRVTITADIKLTANDGRVIWSAKGISQHQTYMVEEDKQATEENKSDAIEYVSKRLAEYIIRSMSDDF
jgi:outer membrane lipopolysaccharide assembly protein LptE/RlpB